MNAISANQALSKNTSLHIGSSFDASSMVWLPDQTLLVKFFYKNAESARGAMRKFRRAKKTRKGLASCAGILKFVKLFKGTDLFCNS